MGLWRSPVKCVRYKFFLATASRGLPEPPKGVLWRGRYYCREADVAQR